MEDSALPARSTFKSMQPEELKNYLKQLQQKKQSLSLKNQQLNMQVNDIRQLIKTSSKESQQQLQYQSQRKEKLQQQVQSYEKALKVANTNSDYQEMVQYKRLMGN